MIAILFLTREVTGEAITALTKADREHQFTKIRARSEVADVLLLIRTKTPDLIIVGVGLDDLSWLPQGVKIILLKNPRKEGLNVRGHFVMRPDRVSDEYAVRLALCTLGFVQP